MAPNFNSQETTTHKEKLLCAYLDGELSAAEAASFEQLLSNSERDQLSGELQLESGIVSLISDGPACPAAAWEKALDRIQNLRPRTLRTKMKTWMWRGMAMAAGFAVVVAVALPEALNDGESDPAQRSRALPNSEIASMLPTFLAFNAVDVDALREQAQVNGDEASVSSFMNEHGFMLGVSSAMPRGHHSPALLGAREIRYESEPVLELFYACCGQPMKLVVAKQGGAAAEALSATLGMGDAQSSRLVSNYVVAVVGRHQLDSLAELIHF